MLGSALLSNWSDNSLISCASNAAWGGSVGQEDDLLGVRVCLSSFDLREVSAAGMADNFASMAFPAFLTALSVIADAMESCRLRGDGGRDDWAARLDGVVHWLPVRMVLGVVWLMTSVDLVLPLLVLPVLPPWLTMLFSLADLLSLPSPGLPGAITAELRHRGGGATSDVMERLLFDDQHSGGGAEPMLPDAFASAKKSPAKRPVLPLRLLRLPWGVKLRPSDGGRCALSALETQEPLPLIWEQDRDEHRGS